MHFPEWASPTRLIANRHERASTNTRISSLNPSRERRKTISTISLTAALSISISLLLLTAGNAPAQYADYESPVPSEETAILIEEAVEEAADVLYEELAEELTCEISAGVGCSKVLDPADPVGSSCSCSATGPGAKCTGPYRNRFGQITHVICEDGQNKTICSYTGPPQDRKKSCTCVTR